jgi:hypothetical protein
MAVNPRVVELPGPERQIGERSFRARGNDRDDARRRRQLVPQEQSLADAVRDGLLRYRADGGRFEPFRYRPIRALKSCGSVLGSAI